MVLFRFNTHSLVHIKQGQVFQDGNVAELITGLAGEQEQEQEQEQGPGEAAVSGGGIKGYTSKLRELL